MEFDELQQLRLQTKELTGQNEELTEKLKNAELEQEKKRELLQKAQIHLEKIPELEAEAKEQNELVNQLMQEQLRNKEEIEKLQRAASLQKEVPLIQVCRMDLMSVAHNIKDPCLDFEILSAPKSSNDHTRDLYGSLSPLVSACICKLI